MHNRCLSQSPGDKSSFIFMLPHDNIKQSFFSEWVDKYNVVGLIIVSNVRIDSTYIYLKPKLITTIDYKQAYQIEEQLNKMEGPGMVVKAKIDHDYATNCPEIQGGY